MTTQAYRGARTPRIAIIGTGFGGLCMAMQLKKAGIESFVLLEREGSIGGTWRDNTYPGAACDVQSHLYSYSFELKSDWARTFALQPEIRAYLEGCVAKHDLGPHIRFNTDVVAADFDERAGLWVLTTRDGFREAAHILVTACGQLNRPAYPRIDGIEEFTGTTFHSARWNHDHDLSGRSVAVIGTGASSIQFVPSIVPAVGRLRLFQRSGAWVIAKRDRAFTGVEQRMFAALPLLARVYRAMIYWRNESRALAFTRFGWFLRWAELEARWLAWRHVKDPVKRRKLIPAYRAGCKRLLISNDWYPAMNSDHVEIITDAIDHVEADAIVTTDGARYAVDTIIFGTGFLATDFLAPMKVTGLDGRDLNEEWSDGAEAYNGICVSGFPNLFMLYGPNTNLAHSSIVFMLESQVRYVLQCVRLLLTPGLRFMDVKADRQREYCATIQERLKRTIWETGCTSWYRTAAGRNTNNWPGFTFYYRLMTGRLDLRDYEVRHAPARA